MAGTRLLPPPPVGNDPKSPAYRDWFYKIQQSVGTINFVNAISVGSQVQTSGTAAFVNSNNISFGMSNSSIITASYNFNISAGSTSNNRNNVTFANSNGVSFGLNAGTITASVNNSSAPGTGFTSTSTGGSNIVGTLNSSGLSLGIPNYLTTARASTDGIGLNTAQTNITWTVNSSGLSLNAGGYAGTGLTTTSTSGIILKGTNNTAGLSLGVPNYITNINVSAGTTSNNLSAVTFVDSNGVSFGLNGSQITASVSVPSGNITVSAGTTSNGLNNLVFSNLNGVTFGLDASTITASINPVGGNVTFSAGTSTAYINSVVFSNSNNIVFGLSGSTITAQAVSLKVYEPVVISSVGATAPTFAVNSVGDILMAWGGGYAA